MPTPQTRNYAGTSVTAVLCTYNRCKTLATALESIAASQFPPSVNWEVLVVDNNSTDGTPEVVQSFSRRHPERFRYLFEEKAGKSFALNSGIEHARGEVLAFVDDDVTVEPTWLHSLTESLHDGEWCGAGGRILPPRKFAPPSWFSLAELGGILCAHFDLGDEPCELRQAPYGTNMAFRRRMFEKYGGFRTDLGPRPGCQIRNEDTEFGNRLITAGERLRYEPSAIVYHLVGGERLSRGYFLSWWFDYGRARVREQEKRPDPWGINRGYFSIAKSAGLLIPMETLQWIVSLNQKKRFLHKCELWHMAGRVAETYRSLVDDKRNRAEVTVHSKSENEVGAETSKRA